MSLLKILFVLLIPFSLFAQSGYYSESEVKAVYLEKFTHFIDWPSGNNNEDTSKPFIVGFVGNNDIANIFKEKFAAQKLKDKKVEVLGISDLNEIKRCNMLFISKSNIRHIDQILSYTKNKPILTVSDDIQLSQKGVLIILFKRKDHIYFNIDKNAAEKSGLYISTLLLNLSKNITIEEN